MSDTLAEDLLFLILHIYQEQNYFEDLAVEGTLLTYTCYLYTTCIWLLFKLREGTEFPAREKEENLEQVRAGYI